MFAVWSNHTVLSIRPYTNNSCGKEKKISECRIQCDIIYSITVSGKVQRHNEVIWEIQSLAYERTTDNNRGKAVIDSGDKCFQTFVPSVQQKKRKKGMTRV